MRKCKIESRRAAGCIKVMDNPSSNDNIGAVSGVYMLRVATVLEVSAHLVSKSKARGAISHCSARPFSRRGGLTTEPQPGRLRISVAQMMQRRTAI